MEQKLRSNAFQAIVQYQRVAYICIEIDCQCILIEVQGFYGHIQNMYQAKLYMWFQSVTVQTLYYDDSVGMTYIRSFVSYVSKMTFHLSLIYLI